MNEAIRQILSTYEIRSVEDSLRALREVMQEIALLGLWRSKFFEKAAFYGGTALRVLYGLDRFSEDLDFSLLEKGLSFDLADYQRSPGERACVLRVRCRNREPGQAGLGGHPVRFSQGRYADPDDHGRVR